MIATSISAPDALERHPRVDVADVLRGFAVMAIVLIHAIEHFNFYSFPPTEGQSVWLNFADRAIWDGIFFLFAGKAYAIFALLFGFSFFIQDDNRRRRGSDFRGRFCWRLVLLLLVGQLNAAFFTAEVLVLYALVGFVLPLVCRLSTRALLILAGVCVMQPMCLWQIARAAADPDYTILAFDTSSYWAATFEAQSTAGFWETVKVNLWEGQLASLAWAWDHGRVFQTAGLFIAGMLIGRHGWLLECNLPKWGRVLAVAICCFFPLYGLKQHGGAVRGQPQYPHPGQDAAVVACQSELHAHARERHYVCLLQDLTPRLASRPPSPLWPHEHDQLCDAGHHRLGPVYHWGLFLQLGITASELVGIAIFMVQYAVCRIWVKPSHPRAPRISLEARHMDRMALWRRALTLVN